MKVRLVLLDNCVDCSWSFRTSIPLHVDIQHHVSFVPLIIYHLFHLFVTRVIIVFHKNKIKLTINEVGISIK